MFFHIRIMILENKIVTVFGGTGFIGRQVVRALAAAGAQVKVVTRVPERGYFLKPCGNVGQIVPLACDYGDEKSIAACVKGSAAVVNCVGILHEKKRGQFEKIHTWLPGVIARACRDAKVQRLTHIAALGTQGSHSRYAKSKREGEAAVMAAFPKATILRPSVVFGADDNFFNMFARMAGLLPALPLIGGGHTKFQPVYVGDVAAAVLKTLTLPEDGADDPRGRIYELGGPQVLSFRAVYETLFRETGRRRALISLPWGIARIQAGFMGILPNPPLTPDQVEQLKSDSVVTPGALTLADLGITATALDVVLPQYLARYRPGGRFGKVERA